MSLTHQDRELLRALRDAHEPTAQDRARVRGALVSELGAASGLAPKDLMAATRAGVAKVLTTIALVGAVGGGIAMVAHRTNRPTPRALATPSPLSPASTPTPPAPPPVVAAPVNAPSESRSATVAPAPLQVRDAKARRATAPIATPASPSIAAPSAEPRPNNEIESAPSPLMSTTLDAELRLVRGGATALAAGDASRALSLFDEHARAFPNGLLAEERAAERISALCALGRNDEGRSAATIFLRDRAGSPLAASVRASCGAK